MNEREKRIVREKKKVEEKKKKPPPSLLTSSYPVRYKYKLVSAETATGVTNDKR